MVNEHIVKTGLGLVFDLIRPLRKQGERRDDQSGLLSLVMGRVLEDLSNHLHCKT